MAIELLLEFLCKKKQLQRLQQQFPLRRKLGFKYVQKKQLSKPFGAIRDMNVASMGHDHALHDASATGVAAAGQSTNNLI
jgi:hypothetical protein